MKGPPAAGQPEGLSRSFSRSKDANLEDRSRSAGLERTGDGGVVIATSDAAFQLIAMDARAHRDGLPAEVLKGQPLVRPCRLKLIRYDEDKQYDKHRYKIILYKWLKEEESKEITLHLSKDTLLDPASATLLKRRMCALKKEHESPVAAAMVTMADGVDPDVYQIPLHTFHVQVPRGDFWDSLGNMFGLMRAALTGGSANVSDMELGFTDADEAHGWYEGVSTAVAVMQKDDPTYMAVRQAVGGPQSKSVKNSANRLAATWGLPPS